MSHEYVAPLLMMPTLKSLLGLDQIWIMVELGLRIQQSIQVTLNERDTSQRMQYIIRIGRITFATLITCLLTTALVIFLDAGQSRNFEERQSYIALACKNYVTTMQLVLFALMTISICVLVYLL